MPFDPDRCSVDLPGKRASKEGEEGHLRSKIMVDRNGEHVVVASRYGKAV